MKRILVVMLVLLAMGSQARAQAQPAGPGPVKATCVMVRLTRKQNVPREKLMAVLQQEVRETVADYLDGKILQWWSRADGQGVVFLLNYPDVESAKAMMESLPLGKNGLVDLDYTPLAPLQPLRLLLASPKEASKE